MDPNGHWDIDGNSSGGFGGHGIGNPGSYGGGDSVSSPGFSDGYGTESGIDSISGVGARTRSDLDRNIYDGRQASLGSFGDYYQLDCFGNLIDKLTGQYLAICYGEVPGLGGKLAKYGINYVARSKYLGKLLGYKSPVRFNRWGKLQPAVNGKYASYSSNVGLLSSSFVDFSVNFSLGFTMAQPGMPPGLQCPTALTSAGRLGRSLGTICGHVSNVLTGVIR